MLIPIRKVQAGSDSLGHVWEEDGAVVGVSAPHAEALLAIKDAGFTVADDSWPEPEADGHSKSVEFSEVDPKTETAEIADGSDEDGDESSDAEDGPAKPAAKKTTARKTAAAKQT